MHASWHQQYLLDLAKALHHTAEDHNRPIVAALIFVGRVHQPVLALADQARGWPSESQLPTLRALLDSEQITVEETVGLEDKAVALMLAPDTDRNALSRVLETYLDHQPLPEGQRISPGSR